MFSDNFNNFYIVSCHFPIFFVLFSNVFFDISSQSWGVNCKKMSVTVVNKSFLNTTLSCSNIKFENSTFRNTKTTLYLRPSSKLCMNNDN